MYLPPLPRYASLSLVGWRIFGSLVRSILVRTGESEVTIRQAIAESKESQLLNTDSN
ncbi:hypothetical protein PN462_20865 [Spirulina sp. CS-785/01]|uniref:hypothetical protein n=1 Tax=Spirulina sp. CS-785/01 TaxID=3021716 RepID=UPI00232CC611|nr:hypothetical protein [Spirulina sp. CS-785/01]MDB9315577.1 hypothetical protein [Spirulina sp. CS-785/01]